MIRVIFRDATDLCLTTFLPLLPRKGDDVQIAGRYYKVLRLEWIVNEKVSLTRQDVEVTIWLS